MIYEFGRFWVDTTEQFDHFKHMMFETTTWHIELCQKWANKTRCGQYLWSKSLTCRSLCSSTIQLRSCRVCHHHHLQQKPTRQWHCLNCLNNKWRQSCPFSNLTRRWWYFSNSMIRKQAQCGTCFACISQRTGPSVSFHHWFFIVFFNTKN